MKYYLNNRDNRANLAANDFDEFFRPFERRIPYGERETRRKQGKRRKGTLYTQREEKRQLFEELLRRQRR